MIPNIEQIRKDTPAVIGDGELHAIEQVLAAGDRYGCGNMIAWLQTVWTIKLIASGLDEKTARHASGGSGYPLNWVKQEP